MTGTKKFQGTSAPPKFYDRKVLRYGYSATISMGRIIPKDWRYVRVTPVATDEKSIMIRIDKLLGDETNSQAPNADKTGKQDT